MTMASAFAGLSEAEVVTQRAPEPVEGLADWLVTSVRKKDNRKGGYRVEVQLTCVNVLEGANNPGDEAQFCIFSGDYFLKEFKELAICLCGGTETDAMGVGASLIPEEVRKTLDDLQLRQKSWEMLGEALCGQLEFQQGVGTVDGNVVIRLHCQWSTPKGTGTYDANGQELMTKPYLYKNLRGHANVELLRAEVEDTMKIRVFGSTQRFDEVLTNMQG